MKKNKISFLSLNLELIKYNPVLFFKNLFIWLSNALVPLLIGVILNYFFDDVIYTNIGKVVFFTTCFLATSLLYSLLMQYGGVIDAQTKYHIRSLLIKNIVHSFSQNEQEENNGAIFDSINSDTVVIQEIPGIEIDTFNRLIFFICSLIILLKINLIITLVCFLPMILAINVIVLFSNKLLEYFAAKRKKS